MLIDTHCHLNMIIKKNFDVALKETQVPLAQEIILQAKENNVKKIINVGTSLIESLNCIELAKHFESVYATVGIHPNDCTTEWRVDLNHLKKKVENKKENKIVGIGECGVDRHYEGYNLQRQNDAFKAQIELALEYDLALVVHSRDAYDETLFVLEQYKNEKLRGVIHCFSYDLAFAKTAIEMGFVIGLGGTITYPKNNVLRSVAQTIPLDTIVLETDAPFLPPQSLRGKQNQPKNIKLIAQYLADLRQETLTTIAQQTTSNAQKTFKELSE